MERKEYQLRITLKSDLCTGSGYAYAGMIDSDVCCDSCGLPYIPSRRLKGCLRESAEMILQHLEDKEVRKQKLRELFGEAGQDGVRGLILDNAYPENYGAVYGELSRLEQEYGTYIRSQSVLDCFTAVKAQTRIDENGVAVDNSLRFTRTVNQYGPGSQEKSGGGEMQFLARVSIEAEEEKERLLHRTVKALRQIGMNRNRGLGSVRCELLPAEEDNRRDIDFSVIDDDAAMYTLKYRVRNLSPLILSMNNDSKTEKYIHGRSVMGAFAGEYLASGKRGDTEEFAELFLKNKVVFGTLYPAGDRIFYPAPSYINRLKKTKKYVNISCQLPSSENLPPEDDWKEYFTGNGNQPKKLKGVFTAEENGRIQVKEPETDIVYHHTKKSDKQNAEFGQLLYTTEVLRRQQLFAGEIRGCGRDIRTLAAVLQKGEFRFGKSRSAQYGLCILEGKPVIEKAKEKDTVFRAGDSVLVILQSDAVFMNDNGYTVKCREIREQVRRQLGIRETGAEAYSELEAGEVTGYYSVWNLKRPSMPVVKAGSTLEFHLAEDLKLSDTVQYVGMYGGEGFGRAVVLRNRKEDFRILEESAENSLPADKETVGRPREMSELTARICRNVLLEEARECLMNRSANSGAASSAEKKAPGIRFGSPAALGRVTLMLSESIRKYPDNAERRYQDFHTRIQEIKTEDTRKCAEKLLKELICKNQTFLPENIPYLKPDFSAVLADLREKYRLLLGEDVSFVEKLTDMWSEYLMAVLIQQKYEFKKQEERT